jgi:hypothetical protein
MLSRPCHAQFKITTKKEVEILAKFLNKMANQILAIGPDTENKALFIKNFKLDDSRPILKWDRQTIIEDIFNKEMPLKAYNALNESKAQVYKEIVHEYNDTLLVSSTKGSTRSSRTREMLAKPCVLLIFDAHPQILIENRLQDNKILATKTEAEIQHSTMKEYQSFSWPNHHEIESYEAVYYIDGHGANNSVYIKNTTYIIQRA